MFCQIRERYNDQSMRRLHSFLLLLPILLLGLVLLLWVRSYLPEQTFFRSHQGRILIFFVAGRYALWFDSSSTEFWAIAIPLAALSGWSMARRRSRRERLLPGHCRACGYDLRGSGGRCPECGHEPASPAPTTPAAAAG